MSRLSTYTPDWYEDENVPSGIDPQSQRLKAALAIIRKEFFAAMRDKRDLHKMHNEIKRHYSFFLDGEINLHEFVVLMLEILNAHGVPLTGKIMDEYDISDFELFPEDFDRVCLDCVSSKHRERVVVDYDSLPEDFNDSVPMSRKEVGDLLKGTLQLRADGTPYLQGYKDEYIYSFVSDESFPGNIKDTVGKPIEARVENGKVVDFNVIKG